MKPDLRMSERQKLRPDQEGDDWTLLMSEETRVAMKIRYLTER
jgi:hypothetical protein